MKARWKATSDEDPELTERFTREARTLKALDHPNIVTLFDFGEREGWLYILMEFIDGCTLAERLKLGALGLNETRELLEPVTAAL